MADFRPAFEFTMDHEDRHRIGAVTEDAGGRTRFGIAEKFHPDLPEEFFTGPAVEALATAEKITEEDYWGALHLDVIEDQDVANKLFDMAVNMGLHQAARLAQRAARACGISDLVEDGILGKHSFAAINSSEPAALLSILRELCESYYRHIAANNPAQAQNLEGWLKRAAA